MYPKSPIIRLNQAYNTARRKSIHKGTPKLNGYINWKTLVRKQVCFYCKQCPPTVSEETQSYLDRKRISRVHHHGKIRCCVNDHIAIVVRQDG